MRQIETELAQLELVLKEKRDLLEKKKQEEEEALSDVQKLAIALHEQKCNSNHMDQCSWGMKVGLMTIQLGINGLTADG